MGMTIGSMNKDRRVIVLKRPDGTEAGRITKTGGNSGKKTKKLHYNFKEISARILQARTSGNAGQTVIMARAQLASLRQKARGREYDDEELAAAIIHAEKMVRIAKKKQKNLKAEENAERGVSSGSNALSELQDKEELPDTEEMCSGNSGKNEDDLKQLMQKMEMLMEEAMRAAAEADDMDELAGELMEAGEETDPADLEIRKKKHRSDELKEIIEADMKYLKSLFDRLEREKQSNSAAKSAGGSNDSGNVSGVLLELGGEQMPVPAVEMAASPVGGSIDVTV